MAEVRKVPCYQIESSFTGKKWKGYTGSQGCVPLDTQATVSMDRLAPGEPIPPPPPKPPKPTREQLKAQQAAQQAEEARQRLIAQQARKQAQVKEQGAQSKEPSQPGQPAIPDAEECENPPVFDMLDIPAAMEKMGWPVSARLANKWFSTEYHKYDDNPKSVQPIDKESITLNWVLKFKNVKNKYKQLLAKNIYSAAAVHVAKGNISKRIKERFVDQNSIDFGFDLAAELKDVRQFHLDWQFQQEKISNFDTLNNWAMTDLTASLANFSIYVAVGKFELKNERYFIYGKASNTKSYCVDLKIKITHVYVYVKDNYSFNDDKESKDSQYLGHWNKSGVILSTGGVISEIASKVNKRIYTGMGNTPSQLEYLMKGFTKPVDARRGFGKFKKQDVYFPIHNQTYQDWRTRHHRGGDFMVYSEPELQKLKTPIEFSLETLCRKSEKM